MTEPYFTTACGRGRIYHGDALAIFEEATVGVTALVSDPPYGIGNVGVHSGGGLRGIHSKQGSRHKESPGNRRRIAGDNEPFDPSPWLDFPFVLLWGANHFSQRLPHGRWIAWDKLDGREAWDSFSDVEFAWRNSRGKDEIVRHLWKGLCQAGAGVKRHHPTQKPVELMRWCLRDVPPDALVLDPYLGSGTTGVAALQTGRRFVGVELDEEYCEVAARRLQKAAHQPPLFPGI